MLLLVDKPKGLTSHDVVDRLREITGERKIGHGGTLDPNATGLLVIGITKSGTKRLGEFTKGKDKEYVAEIMLGEERDTGDVEGSVISNPDDRSFGSAVHKRLSEVSGAEAKAQRTDKVGEIIIPNLSDVKNVLSFFIGEQEQIPPIHSAIKVKGKKAYELARKGRRVTMEPRNITIHSIELLEYCYPILRIRTLVSSGTYIRALARDIGRELGTYGYLNNLRRTKIGEYDVSEAVTLEELGPNNWKEFVDH